MYTSDHFNGMNTSCLNRTRMIGHHAIFAHRHRLPISGVVLRRRGLTTIDGHIRDATEADRISGTTTPVTDTLEHAGPYIVIEELITGRRRRVTSIAVAVMTC